MQLKILAVGRVKDTHTKALCDDYAKRVRRHLPLEIIEAKRDAELLKRIPDRAHVVALEVDGRARDSPGLARWLQGRMSHGQGALVFLIGGADGLGPELRQRAHESITLGPLTLPHRLARIVLVEQLYRALSIQRGEPYHK